MLGLRTRNVMFHHLLRPHGEATHRAVAGQRHQPALQRKWQHTIRKGARVSKRERERESHKGGGGIAGKLLYGEAVGVTGTAAAVAELLQRRHRRTHQLALHRVVGSRAATRDRSG